MRIASVVPVERVEFADSCWQWPFVAECRAEIDSYFLRQKQTNPTLWNGRLLLLRDVSIRDGILTGTLFECDYASLLAGLAWDAFRNTVKACFAGAALQSSDRKFIVGLMAQHTRNAGQLVFPSGSIEPDDMRSGRVDLVPTIQRELTEETGIEAADVDTKSGWYVVFAGPRVAIVKVIRVSCARVCLAECGTEQETHMTTNSTITPEILDQLLANY